MNKPNATASVTKNGWLVLVWSQMGGHVVAMPPGRFTEAGCECTGRVDADGYFCPDGSEAAHVTGLHALSCGTSVSRVRGGRFTVGVTLAIEVPNERNFWRDAVHATLVGRGRSHYEAVADLGRSFDLVMRCA